MPDANRSPIPGFAEWGEAWNKPGPEAYESAGSRNEVTQ